MAGELSCVGLPSSNRRIDVDRVDLEPVADAPGAFGCDEGGAAAEEGVEDSLAATGAVLSASASMATGFTVG
jgi:hypothetical protein